MDKQRRAGRLALDPTARHLLPLPVWLAGRLYACAPQPPCAILRRLLAASQAYLRARARVHARTRRRRRLRPPVLPPRPRQYVRGGDAARRLPDRQTARARFCCFQFGGTLFLTLRMPVLLASVSLANDLMAIPTWWSWLINCISVVANCWCFVYLAPTIPCDCCCPTKAMTPRASLRRVWVMMRGYFWIVSLSWIEVGIHSLILYAMGDPLMRLAASTTRFTPTASPARFGVVATPQPRRVTLPRQPRRQGRRAGGGGRRRARRRPRPWALSTASQRFRAAVDAPPPRRPRDEQERARRPVGAGPLVERSEPASSASATSSFALVGGRGARPARASALRKGRRPSRRRRGASVDMARQGVHRPG